MKTSAISSPVATPFTASKVTFSAADRAFVFSVARRYVRNDQDAHDIAQDALLSAYRYRDSFRGDSHYRTWLYRIATTTALSFLRSAKRRSNRLASAHADDVTAAVFGESSPAPELQCSSKEQVAKLLHSVSQLAPAYRAVVELRCEDLSEHEVAGQLGLTVSTVKIRAHRARKMLREQLAA
ncbi:MAG: RNA polymerase sigma factor [Kofleriaceae bacterium]|nr:RNA polymerase sigma factor [Kofleriaceae bacterium]